jgi:hypothetical protein
VRRLCRWGSLTTVARELARYKLDFLDVEEDMGHGKSSVLYFFYIKKDCEQDFLCNRE